MAKAACHCLPVTAHWVGASADLTDQLTAGIDRIEHFGPHGQQLQAWPGAAPRARILRQRLAELHAAGVPIIAGTDASLNGLEFGVSLHRELELLD